MHGGDTPPKESNIIVALLIYYELILNIFFDYVKPPLLSKQLN